MVPVDAIAVLSILEPATKTVFIELNHQHLPSTAASKSRITVSRQLAASRVMTSVVEQGRLGSIHRAGTK